MRITNIHTIARSRLLQPLRTLVTTSLEDELPLASRFRRILLDVRTATVARPHHAGRAAVAVRISASAGHELWAASQQKTMTFGISGSGVNPLILARVAGG